MDEEREPYPTEDPRQTGTGDQLPEENPEGQGADDGGERQGPDSGAGAPDTSSEDEGEPGQATGNPGAAG